MAHTCPVCCYPALREPPRSPTGGASYEICPSCGFQFGVSDDDGGIPYTQWRALWKKRAMRWASAGIPAPPRWDPIAQLARLRSRLTPLGQAKSQSPVKRKKPKP